jgi:hypothetical protein
VRQPQPRQERLVTLEEFRIVLQIASDRFFLRIRRRQPASFSCRHFYTSK